MLRFGGRQPRTMMADWGYEGRHGRFVLAGSDTDHEAALAALDRPVLMVTVDGDPILPRSASDYLGARLRSADVTPVHIPRSQNGGEPFDHVRWARRTPGAVLAPVVAWLGDALRRAAASAIARRPPPFFGNSGDPVGAPRDTPCDDAGVDRDS